MATRHGRDFGLKKGQYRAKNLPKNIQRRFLINVQTGELTARKTNKTPVDDKSARVSPQIHTNASGKQSVRTNKTTSKGKTTVAPTITLKGKPKTKKPGFLDPENKFFKQADETQEEFSLRKFQEGKENAAEISAGVGATGIAFKGVQAIKATRAALIAKGATQRAVQAGFAQQAKALPGKAVTQTGTNAVINTAFKTNTKSVGLTKSFILKAGLAVGATSLLVGAIGTYPFAGFIKEEALQTLSFAVKSARDSGDIEGEQAAIDQVNDILDPQAWDKMLASIPYANVLKQLTEFYSAAATKNAADQRSLDRRQEETARLEEQGESDFEKSRRESDEASFERKREFGEEESQRFEDIEGERQEAEEEKTSAENEEKRLNSIYFQLLRDKKFAEAEEFRITNFPT